MRELHYPILRVRETECPRIFADYSDILPAKSSEPLGGNFAEGRGQVYHVDVRKERFDR